MTSLSKELKFEQGWYKNLIQNGNEKVILAKFIRDHFLKENVNRILEVGMGTDPIFASILSLKTKDYLILEKEERKKLILPQNTRLVKHDFEKVNLSVKFDIIILSHVIYYFNNLEKSISKSIQLISNMGKAILVVNGPGNDYGRLKKGFAQITNTECNFTYSRLKNILRNFNYEEFSLESKLYFENHEQLYENIRLFFDLFPDEFNFYKAKIVDWLKQNIKNDALHMDQKIFVVRGVK